MSEGVTQLHDHALACNLSRFPLYAGLISSINYYRLVAVTSSGILKVKQKLGITFDSGKLGSIDFTKFSKLTMCSA